MRIRLSRKSLSAHSLWTATLVGSVILAGLFVGCADSDSESGPTSPTALAETSRDDGGPRHHGKNKGERLIEQLGLVDEQAAAMRSEVQTFRAALGEVKVSLRKETLSYDDAIAAATELAIAHEANVAKILDADQLEKLAEIRQSRAQKKLDHWADDDSGRFAHRMERMTEKLELSETQASQITEIHLGGVQLQQEVLERVLEGTTYSSVASFEIAKIWRETHAAVRDVLTEEQRELFDSFKKHRGPGRGNGRGHGGHRG